MVKFARLLVLVPPALKVSALAEELSALLKAPKAVLVFELELVLVYLLV